jgi:hypothetical protein
MTDLTYRVTSTDAGDWLHPAGSDFLFAYIDSKWSSEEKIAVASAFKTGLTLPNKIKKAVLDTSGQDVVKGLYLLDQLAMTEAMNSIDGMGMTNASQEHESGEGTAVSINAEFFKAILGGLSGDVGPLMNYLTSEMGDLQAQTQKSDVTGCFGTVIGTVSLMPELDVVTTDFSMCSRRRRPASGSSRSTAAVSSTTRTTTRTRSWTTCTTRSPCERWPTPDQVPDPPAGPAAQRPAGGRRPHTGADVSPSTRSESP